MLKNKSSILLIYSGKIFNVTRIQWLYTTNMTQKKYTKKLSNKNLYMMKTRVQECFSTYHNGTRPCPFELKVIVFIAKQHYFFIYIHGFCFWILFICFIYFFVKKKCICIQILPKRKTPEKNYLFACIE